MAEKRACGSMDSRFRGNDDRVCWNILLHPIALRLAEAQRRRNASIKVKIMLDARA